MAERRYNDDEVSAIFAKASEEEPSAPHRLAPSEGMTLADLQGIGREAGISAERVAKAALSLDETRQPEPAKFLGLPVGVARTVTLDRRLTDAEWEQLVVDLRDTFNARGSVRSDGSFRQWANGNLQVLVEPVGEGQRIRFRTIKGDARPLMIGGLGMMGVAAATTVSGLIASVGMGDVGMMAMIGAGLFAWGALRLPGWAKTRSRQMEELAERLMRRR